MTISNDSAPAFLIVGTGRSGTTLVRTIMCGHPDIYVPGETGFLPTLFKTRAVWWRGDELQIELFVRLAFANGRLRRAGLPQSELIKYLRSNPPTSPNQAVGRIYQLFGARENATLVGDKTPGYIDHLPLLSRVNPRVKVIQLVRHPLDVVASLKLQPWGPDNVLAAAMQWRLNQERAQRAGLSERSHLVVRLEDLIADPERVTRRMTAHLNVDFSGSMLDYSRNAESIISQNIHPASHSGLQSALATTRDWSLDLDAREAELAWTTVQSMAEQFGYAGPPLAGGRWLLSARARARLVGFNTARQWRRVQTLRRLLVP